jgi:hypothetical protein
LRVKMPGVYLPGKSEDMKNALTIAALAALLGTAALVWSQEVPGPPPASAPGDTAGVRSDGRGEEGDAAGSEQGAQDEGEAPDEAAAEETEGPPVLGAQDKRDVEGAPEREIKPEAGEGASGAGEEAPGDKPAPGREVKAESADEDTGPPSGEAEAPAGAEDDEAIEGPEAPYPREAEQGAHEGAGEDGIPGERPSGRPEAAASRAAEAVPPGGEQEGPPRAGSDEGSRYGYTLTLRSYRGPRHLRFQSPDFGEGDHLNYDFDAVIDEIWLDYASSRTFEAEERDLSDFSEIDIPIKFPDTIGRVIGQGANLSVSGSEQITFGGQSSYIVNEQITERGQKSKFPQLDMKQHLKIDLNGTVGEKIHVTVHHDSEIQTPLENRIKLRYEGDDDEIVQNIEMGNTNLSIPGSQFVSYSGQHQGLFGAKMLARMGALDITAIASKQEGKTASSRFEGAAKKDSVRIEDTGYLKNRFFFLTDPELVTGDAMVESVWVYVDDGVGTNNEGEGVVNGYPFIDAVPRDSSSWASLGYKYPGKFNLLERNRDYTLNELTGEINLVRALEDGHTLAARYVWGGKRVGGYDEQGRLILKMIRLPYNEYQADTEYWHDTIKLERKNVYSLRANFVSEQGVEVEIFRYDAETGGDKLQNTYPYRKILGLDLYDENSTRASAKNDWQTDDYVDPGRVYGDLGLLEFPDLKPFDPGTYPEGERPEQLEVKNPAIY